MMKQVVILLFSLLISGVFSYTCTNLGDSDRDIRFNNTNYTYCYSVPTVECGYGTYIPYAGHTCRLLSVKVTDHSLVTPDYMGSERCGCIDAVFGHLVIMIDANPGSVTDLQWELRIIDTLDWFYHGVTQERVPGSTLSITYIFLHGSSYFVTTVDETYNIFTGTELTTNPWKTYALTESITKPCDAINYAIDILNAVPLDYHSRRRLFYWGFSTPDLTSCSTSGRSFKDISTYAVRQTLSVNLDSIESTYGSFSLCNWYQSPSDSFVSPSQAIQNRAIIGTLSDFLCAIDKTPSPTEAPTLPPTTSAPTSSPIMTSGLPETLTPPPTLKPTLYPTTWWVSTQKPTWSPTQKPTWWVSTEKPTWSSTQNPTWATTQKPTQKPVWASTEKPTWSPTQKPTKESPTPKPTKESPTPKPTKESPTPKPTKESPTPKPTLLPTLKPTILTTTREDTSGVSESSSNKDSTSTSNSDSKSDSKSDSSSVSNKDPNPDSKSK